jgi:hypothetical protein
MDRLSAYKPIPARDKAVAFWQLCSALSKKLISSGQEIKRQMKENLLADSPITPRFCL